MCVLAARCCVRLGSEQSLYQSLLAGAEGNEHEAEDEREDR